MVPCDLHGTSTSLRSVVPIHRFGGSLSALHWEMKNSRYGTADYITFLRGQRDEFLSSQI